MKPERNNASRQGAGGTDQGFSLIEVMISIALLTIGLLSLLGIFGVAMAATQTSQENNTAKLLADGAMEGILTARETANINWSQINNTGSGGIFLPRVPADKLCRNRRNHWHRGRRGVRPSNPRIARS